MSRSKSPDPRLEAIRQVDDLLDQAADLVATIDVVRTPHEIPEFEAIAKQAGLRAVAIGAALMCREWQSPAPGKDADGNNLAAYQACQAAKERLRLCKVGNSISVTVLSARALAAVIIEHTRWSAG